MDLSTGEPSHVETEQAEAVERDRQDVWLCFCGAMDGSIDWGPPPESELNEADTPASF